MKNFSCREENVFFFFQAGGGGEGEYPGWLWSLCIGSLQSGETGGEERALYDVFRYMYASYVYEDLVFFGHAR